MESRAHCAMDGVEFVEARGCAFTVCIALGPYLQVGHGQMMQTVNQKVLSLSKSLLRILGTAASSDQSIQIVSLLVTLLHSLKSLVLTCLSKGQSQRSIVLPHHMCHLFKFICAAASPSSSPRDGLLCLQ